jgi:hypothetical protein
MSGQGYMNPRFVSKDELRRRIVGLEAECERLKCCGNCGHSDFDEVLFCGCGGEGVTMPWNWHTNSFDHCHFTPSRWESGEGKS